MRQRAVVLVLLVVGLVGPGLGRPSAAAGSLQDQKIDWERCPKHIIGKVQVPPWLVFECGRFQVPRDWDRPDGKTRLDIAVSRLRPAIDTASRVLLLNPGGPGAPARTLPLQAVVGTKRFDVARNFQVIGVDVRGVGGSTRYDCEWHDGQQLPDSRDRRTESLDRILDELELDVRSCQRTGGELGQFINTAQTVHDFDLLRRLLGRERISYVGYSGGTWLGAYYATYFPDRVERFVLDSIVDFTSTWEDRTEPIPAAFQRRFEADFVPYVARYHERYRLGATPEAVHRSIERLRARLVDRPAELNGKEVTGRHLDGIISEALYSGRKFQHAAEKIQALHHGVRSGPDEPDRHPETRLNNDVNLAIQCNDTPSQGDRKSLIADTRRLGAAYPLKGWYHPYLNECVFWKRPPLAMPRPSGNGLPPVLLVNSERDPATNIEEARHAAANFKGARLLTVSGGDHGLYMRNNDCVDAAVDAFLLEGKLPRHGATCPGLPIPPPR
jgi:pimeloyl-ACP methyl ester carboxylesterase